MGSGLKELKRIRKGEKLSDGKLLGGGKVRLTNKIIDKMQKYGEAI